MKFNFTSNFDPDELLRRLEQQAIEQASEAISAKILTMRCSEHNLGATVTIQDNEVIVTNICCEDFRTKINDVLSEPNL